MLCVYESRELRKIADHMSDITLSLEEDTDTSSAFRPSFKLMQVMQFTGLPVTLTFSMSQDRKERHIHFPQVRSVTGSFLSCVLLSFPSLALPALIYSLSLSLAFLL